jgi:formylmethanofuran dehydrogenase subunit B
MSRVRTFENVACTICGCVCDDLRVRVADNRVEEATGTCSLSEKWFLEQDSRQPAVAEIDGQPATLDAALARATEILRDARSPLVYGLSRSSTEGQRSAVALAELLGATLDTSAALCHAPSVVALQEVGEVTCTLGEVRNRADLVIFWGVNPAKSHPRHFERYSTEPRGRYLPQGRAGRTVVVVDVKPTATTERADIFLQVDPDADYEVLTALRCLVQGLPVERASAIGVPLPALKSLAAQMKQCQYGIAFFGLGLSMSRAGQHNVEALLQLVTALNQYTRFSARRMRIPGDVTGADMVLAWQTGYPFSINFGRGYPRYNPDEFSGPRMLERGEVDACLFVGSEGTTQFTDSARAALEGIPTIALDYPTVPSRPAPTVRFTTAVYGIHRPGIAYRMDGVPIPLRPFLASAYPSDDEILDRLAARIARP